MTIDDFGLMLRRYSKALLQDMRAAKLREALAPHCYDGTEIHHEVDRELPAAADQDAAASIRAAIKNKYCDTIHIDTAVEVVRTLLEREEDPNGN
jgi:hypothetical protein